MISSSTSEISPGKTASRGFSLIELIVVLAILVTVSSIILSVIFSMATTQGTVSNRTEMHSSVRSATELLQQEIGQAGKVATPFSAGATAQGITAPATLTQDVAGDGASHTPNASDVSCLFPGEVLYVGPDLTNGQSRELITLTGVSPSTVTSSVCASATGTITAIWQDPHSGTATTKAAIGVQGVFPAGIVPPTGSKITYADSSGVSHVQTLSASSAAPANVVTPGSSGSLLKMYGDINGDGKMVYVEYQCTQGTSAAPGTFSRRIIPFNTSSAKNTTNFPWVTLLSNVVCNGIDTTTGTCPGAVPPCFVPQTQAPGVGNDTFVTNMAVTLTVQTQNKDSKTNKYQWETKALLNVSPRNVYEGWLLDQAPGGQFHMQPMPWTVVSLLNP